MNTLPILATMISPSNMALTDSGATTPHLKIVLVGSWMWGWYQEACADALRSLGCEVEPFSCFHYFSRWVDTQPEAVYKSIWAGFQNKYLVGPTLYRLNWDLVNMVQRTQPDIVWFYNCTHIFPSTLRRIKKLLPDIQLVQYANDNPFSRTARRSYWRHLIAGIPYFDLNLVFRHSNFDDFYRAGAKKVDLLRAYYIPSEDYPIMLGPDNTRFQSDVVFAGHYENDGRLADLEAIARHGYRLNLFGGGWKSSIGLESPLYPLTPIVPVLGDDYRRAICGAKIALCFLSKLNIDTYTTRNFQIPAMQTFCLTEYTEDLASMFKEGVEMEFFRSREELLDKIEYYLSHGNEREQIAQRGYERVVQDGHDVTSRMRQFLGYLQTSRS